MANDITGQTIALAAITQFACQVKQLAKTGHLSVENLTTAINSLFCQNPKNTLDVYGKLSNIQSGLQTLADILRRKPSSNTDCIRYVMGILHLQKRLIKHSSMLTVIGSRLEKSRLQTEHFTPHHDNVVAGLADIYLDTISTFSFRIQVTGEYQYLQQPRISNQIRVLLFAGIRSAILWKQLGGHRWKIILQRNQMIKIAEDLVSQAKTEQLQ